MNLAIAFAAVLVLVLMLFWILPREFKGMRDGDVGIWRQAATTLEPGQGKMEGEAREEPPSGEKPKV
jgi:hypothetical protein